MDLTIVDLALMFKNYQSSKCKIWECLRLYEPVQVAAFIYVLDNLKTNVKDESIELAELRVISGRSVRHEFASFSLVPQHKTHISLLRVEPDNYCLFNNRKIIKTTRIIEFNGHRFSNDVKFATSLDLVETLKDVKRLAALEEPIDFKKSPVAAFNRLLTRVILYNCTTLEWKKFLHYLVFQLFPDNLQLAPRYDNVSNVSSKSMNIVDLYLRYYRMMSNPESFNSTNSMDLRYMIMPKPATISRELAYSKTVDHITQPYYQGYYMIINVSDTSVRCYNRWSEPVQFDRVVSIATQHLINNINCTLIAVLMPTDHNGILRSWRYWSYKSGFVIKIVDIVRFKSKSLIAVPLIERLKYLKHINTTDNLSILDSSKHLVDYENEYYDDTKTDCHSALIGVVLKPRHSLLSSTETLAFKFPLKNTFDLTTNAVISIDQVHEKTCLFFNPELAQYYTIVMIYNHTVGWFHACRYNIDIHQFEHFCKFQREPYDIDPPKYTVSEKIMVVNSPSGISRGVFYLRVYYNDNDEYLGYDRKPQTSRYNLPVTWPFDTWSII